MGKIWGIIELINLNTAVVCRVWWYNIFNLNSCFPCFHVASKGLNQNFGDDVIEFKQMRVINSCRHGYFRVSGGYQFLFPPWVLGLDLMWTLLGAVRWRPQQRTPPESTLTIYKTTTKSALSSCVLSGSGW